MDCILTRWRAPHSLLPTDMQLTCLLHPYPLTCTSLAYHNLSLWCATYLLIASLHAEVHLLRLSYTFPLTCNVLLIASWHADVHLVHLSYPFSLTCNLFVYCILTRWRATHLIIMIIWRATYAFIASFLLTCNSFTYHILTFWFTLCSIFSNHITFNAWHTLHGRRLHAELFSSLPV